MKHGLKYSWLVQNWLFQFVCSVWSLSSIDHAGHSKCSRVIYIPSCVIHRLNLTETVIWALSLWTVQIARVLGVISWPPTENSCQSHNGGDHHSSPQLNILKICSNTMHLTKTLFDVGITANYSKYCIIVNKKLLNGFSSLTLKYWIVVAWQSEFVLRSHLMTK